ncbi:17150_t:CDS:1, partial [Cetraspora pellucida]
KKASRSNKDTNIIEPSEVYTTEIKIFRINETNNREVEIFWAYMVNYYYADKEWQKKLSLLSMMLNKETEPIKYENNDEENNNNISKKKDDTAPEEENNKWEL